MFNRWNPMAKAKLICLLALISVALLSPETYAHSASVSQASGRIIVGEPVSPQEFRGDLRQQSLLSPSSNIALNTELMAYWQLEEASGLRVDATGRGNNLLDNNGVAQLAGKIGNSAQFTSANSTYLSAADNSDLSVGDIDFTLSAWVYLTDKGDSHRIILGKGTSSIYAGQEYELFYTYNAEVTERFGFFVQNGAAQGLVYANHLGAPALNTWYFIVAWHDAGADTVNIQVNDGAVDSAAWSGGSQDTAQEFTLGTIAADHGFYWEGGLDEVGFWKRTLTASERSTLYNCGSGLTYPFTPSSLCPTAKIVFVRPQPSGDGNQDTNIWIMNSNGLSQAQLTTWNAADRWPAISPDGSKIAYVSYRNNLWTLWVMNSDGTSPVQLGMGGNTQSPAWSPDGSQIAFSNDSVDWWEIWTINANGSNPQRLTTHSGASGAPAWSPTGTKIVYINEPSAWSHDLYTVNSDGTGQSLLVSASSTGFSNSMPAWSPDGTQIATIHYPAGNSSGPFDLWLMNADASNGQVLVQGIESPYYDNLAWSMDSNWLVFAKSGQIRRVRWDGAELTQITTTGGWEPDVSAGSFLPLFHVYLPLTARNYCAPLYTDDFSNSASGWFIGDTGDVLWDYLSGEYRLLVRNTDWQGAARTTVQFSDSIAAVDVRNPSGVYGTYGLIFGLSNDWSQFYSLEIDPDGFYLIWRHDPGGWMLLTWGASGAINHDAATNRLKVERNGSLIKAYANDQLLTTVSDGAYTGSRRLGLIVTAYDEPNVDIRFDNFKVYPVSCGSVAGLSGAGQSLSGEASDLGAGQISQPMLGRAEPKKMRPPRHRSETP